MEGTHCKVGNTRLAFEMHINCSRKSVLPHSLFQELQEHRYSLSRIRRSAVQECAERYEFLDYSANHWISHTQEANFENPLWISRAVKFCHIDYESSCGWFVIYSSSNGMRPARSKQSALYWVALVGLINEAKYLLDCALASDRPLDDILDVLEVATAHESHGRDLMRLFLEQQLQDIKISRRMVEGATGNSCDGKEIMALLLAQRGQEVKAILITLDVVERVSPTLGRIQVGREWFYIKSSK